MQEAVEEELLLSASALSGADHPKTIRLRAMVGNQVVIILLDSGSTHSFIDEGILDRLKLQPQSLQTALSVKVANGEVLPCKAELLELTWWIQGNTLSYPLKVVELGGHDIILGMDCLEQWSPMTCHWKEKWVQILYKRHRNKTKGHSDSGTSSVTQNVS